MKKASQVSLKKALEDTCSKKREVSVFEGKTKVKITSNASLN